MKWIANILWMIFGGFVSGALWLLSGVLCCITFVGIPLGMQCFKFAKLTLMPFGKKVSFGGGAVSLIANMIWLIVCGVPMALAEAMLGIALCVTLIGIPLGIQHFKFAKLSLMPFGAKVQKNN